MARETRPERWALGSAVFTASCAGRVDAHSSAASAAPGRAAKTSVLTPAGRSSGGAEAKPRPLRRGRDAPGEGRDETGEGCDRGRRWGAGEGKKGPEARGGNSCAEKRNQTGARGASVGIEPLARRAGDVDARGGEGTEARARTRGAESPRRTASRVRGGGADAGVWSAQASGGETGSPVLEAGVVVSGRDECRIRESLDAASRSLLRRLGG